MNAPHPAEHFTLSGDEKKITYDIDQRISNAGTFTIIKEDHTIGNLVRHSLLRDRRVQFAGYRIPHPLENRMLVKIKTRQGHEPMNCMMEAIEDLQNELRSMQEQFKNSVIDQKQAYAGMSDY